MHSVHCTALEILDLSDNTVCQGSTLLSEASLAALASMPRLRVLGIRPHKAPLYYTPQPDHEETTARKALAAELTERLGGRRRAAAAGAGGCVGDRLRQPVAAARRRAGVHSLGDG